MANNNLSPFLKWAGGKRQLLDKILDRMPTNYNNYYEPFIGGGALLFELQPDSAVINDINASLINTYRIIADRPHEFISTVMELDSKMPKDGKTYYYSLRKRYNNKLVKEEYDTELAALFVFLNKHCFNGLYRVNGKGLFNVPYNNSKRESINNESIIAVSEYLKM